MTAKLQLTVECLPDDQYRIHCHVRGHSEHSMADSDTHKKSSKRWAMFARLFEEGGPGMEVTIKACA